MYFDPAAIPAVLLGEGLFVSGVLAQRRTISRVLRRLYVIAGILAAAPGVFVLSYYLHLVEMPSWFYEFRTTSYSELSVSGIGWILGCCYAQIDPVGHFEKLVWPAGLFALLALPFIKPVLDPIDLKSLHSDCPNHICLQSTYSTCGPASAASILLALGHDASEQALARDALTSKGGTELWYLARAVRQRGFDTAYWVQTRVLVPLPTPAIAGVVLRGGAGHFIALISRNGEQLTIVDPLKGEFVLTDTELKARYHFTGVFLLIHRRI